VYSRSISQICVFGRKTTYYLNYMYHDNNNSKLRSAKYISKLWTEINIQQIKTCSLCKHVTDDVLTHQMMQLYFLSLESQRQSTSLMPNIENWLKWQISPRSALKTPTHSIISFSEVNMSS
jgi:hypothetical protein